MIGASYDRESIFEVEIPSNEVNRPLLFYFFPASMIIDDNFRFGIIHFYLRGVFRMINADQYLLIHA